MAGLVKIEETVESDRNRRSRRLAGPGQNGLGQPRHQAPRPIRYEVEPSCRKAAAKSPPTPG